MSNFERELEKFVRREIEETRINPIEPRRPSLIRSHMSLSRNFLKPYVPKPSYQPKPVIVPPSRYDYLFIIYSGPFITEDTWYVYSILIIASYNFVLISTQHFFPTRIKAKYPWMYVYAYTRYHYTDCIFAINLETSIVRVYNKDGDTTTDIRNIVPQVDDGLVNLPTRVISQPKYRNLRDHLRRDLSALNALVGIHRLSTNVLEYLDGYIPGISDGSYVLYKYGDVFVAQLWDSEADFLTSRGLPSVLCVRFDTNERHDLDVESEYDLQGDFDIPLYIGGPSYGPISPYRLRLPPCTLMQFGYRF